MQTAYRSVQPFFAEFTNVTNRQTDRPTNKHTHKSTTLLRVVKNYGYAEFDTPCDE